MQTSYGVTEYRKDKVENYLPAGRKLASVTFSLGEPDCKRIRVSVFVRIARFMEQFK